MHVGRTHYTKTDVVVAVVRMVVVAIVGARIVLIVVPGAAAQNARLGHGSPCRFPGGNRLPHLHPCAQSKKRHYYMHPIARRKLEYIWIRFNCNFGFGFVTWNFFIMNKASENQNWNCDDN